MGLCAGLGTPASFWLIVLDRDVLRAQTCRQLPESGIDTREFMGVADDHLTSYDDD